MDTSYGHWEYVFWGIMRFSVFLLVIPFRKKTGRRSASIYLAFIINLFAEMYGFPLTIYILSALFGYENPYGVFYLAGIVGVNIFFKYLNPLALVMMIVGAPLVFIGWMQIYNAREKLVIGGVYNFTRHPQYLGILLLTLGMLVRWFTIPNLLMWPILLSLYYRLAKEEEKNMETKFGDEYKTYKRKVSMFIPFLKKERL